MGEFCILDNTAFDYNGMSEGKWEVLCQCTDNKMSLKISGNPIYFIIQSFLSGILDISLSDFDLHGMAEHKWEGLWTYK